MKKAIFLYNRTLFMVEPWLEAGYQCWMYDGQHEDGIRYHPPLASGGQLITVGRYFYPDQTDRQALEIAVEVGDGVEFVFGFPECTRLTVSANRHAAKNAAENPNYLQDAKELCLLVEKVARYCRGMGGPAVPWGFENPKWNRLATLWRTFDYSFDPCDYGGYLPHDDVHPLYGDIIPARDAYNKGTGIWCGNGFVMPEKNIVMPVSKESPFFKKLGGKSLRTKNIRSATPRGFARAVFIANGNKKSCTQQHTPSKTTAR